MASSMVILDLLEQEQQQRVPCGVTVKRTTLAANECNGPNVSQSSAPWRMDAEPSDRALTATIEPWDGWVAALCCPCRRHGLVAFMTLAVLTSAIMMFIKGSICYLLYIALVHISATSEYLSNIKSVQDANQHLENIGETMSLWFSIRNYHYKTRLDSMGKTETYSVDTHYAKDKFVYNSWSDVSPVYPDFTKYPLTKTKMTIAKQFGDQFTATEYQRQKQYFYSTNTRDRHHDYREGVEVEGFMWKMLVEMDELKRPWWLSPGCYRLSSLFLCSLCWRTLMDSRTGVVKYQFKRQVWAVNPLELAPPPYVPQPHGVELQVETSPPANSSL